MDRRHPQGHPDHACLSGGRCRPKRLLKPAIDCHRRLNGRQSAHCCLYLACVPGSAVADDRNSAIPAICPVLKLGQQCAGDLLLNQSVLSGGMLLPFINLASDLPCPTKNNNPYGSRVDSMISSSTTRKRPPLKVPSDFFPSSS